MVKEGKYKSIFCCAASLLVGVGALDVGGAWAQAANGGAGGAAGKAGEYGSGGAGTGGAGGEPGVQPGENGSGGLGGSNGGAGGGGGGGQYGNGSGDELLVNSSLLKGGNGGYGGAGSYGGGNSGGSPNTGGLADQGGGGGFIYNGNYGGGGGGGAGGAGALVTGSNGINSNTGLIQGGVGGEGSGGSVSPGSGGGGGSGVIFLGVGNQFTNSSTGVIYGGKGGDSNSMYTSGGNGGHGVSSNYLNVENSGKIAGGAGGSSGLLIDNVGGLGGDGIVGDNSVITNKDGGTINGGDGGIANVQSVGDTSPSQPGAGGSGVRGDGLTITNSSGAGIRGGDGGLPTLDNPLMFAAGGVGIIGSDLVIVNAGTISGGINSDGLLRADAIKFTGGNNRLELQAGWDIQGDVNATDGIYSSLILGGADDGVFNVSNIGSSAQFQGFQGYYKSGSGTWILTGETISSTPWSIEQGTLQIGSDTSLGDASSSPLTITNGAILSTTSSFEISRDIILNEGGGRIVVSPNTTLTVSSNIGGLGSLYKAGSGEILINMQQSFGGDTIIEAGILRANGTDYLSAASDYSVDSGAKLVLDGYSQTINGLSNAGTLQFGTTAGTVLTVTGSYVGNGGTFEINTYLGDDASPTDMLVVEGDTTGTSNLRVTNSGGAGAQTVEGIKVVDVAGNSDGTFNLLGDYEHNGEQAVVAGAYAYKLRKNGVSTPTDGDWYLRSEINSPEPGPVDPTDPVDPVNPVDPLYQAGVPTYESYAQSLLGLNGVSTLQQRVGNRVWAGNGNRVIAQGADPVGTPYAAPEEAGVAIEGNGVWGRIEGAHNSIDPRFSTSSTEYDQNIFKLQAGLDGLLLENEGGKLIGGVTVHYAHGKTKTNSVHGDGEISTDGYGFGGTLTWYGENGFYLDGQAQLTWYRSDLSSNLASATLVDGNDGFGYALSVESGKRVAIDSVWSLTPQAQLVYSSVDFDDFTDTFGSRVSLDRGDSLQGRLGLTLDHENSWQNANGMLDRAHVYGIANLYYEFLEGTKVDVAGTSFASEKDRLWGGLGIGGSYNWNDDKYSIYGEGVVNTSLNNFGNSYSVKGQAGFKVKW